MKTRSDGSQMFDGVNFEEAYWRFISTAKRLKAEHVDIIKKANAAFASGDHAAWDGYCLERRRIHTAFVNIAVALRMSVCIRTWGEEAKAKQEIEDSAWAFPLPACGENATCTDCERPQWHHLFASDGRVLCPFGRRFWQIARALVDSDCESPGLGCEPWLREIARA